MHLAITNAAGDIPLVVLTDSMNVLQALEKWDHADFARDMKWQRNADVIMAILLAINHRNAPITLVKVKSHKGVALNEVQISWLGVQRMTMKQTPSSPPRPLTRA